MQAYYQRHPKAYSSRIGDEIIILNESGGVYNSLHHSAVWIWEQLEQPKSIEELVSMATLEFDIQTDTAKLEIQNFVHELCKAQLVIGSEQS